LTISSLTLHLLDNHLEPDKLLNTLWTTVAPLLAIRLLIPLPITSVMTISHQPTLHFVSHFSLTKNLPLMQKLHNMIVGLRLCNLNSML
jgi:hypothetical protein